jgi:ketosteroid isomerase-like protein
MPEPPNVEIVRRGYDAFNNGDTSALAALIAENVIWHVPGRSRSPATTTAGKRPSPTSIASTSSPTVRTKPSYMLQSGTTST